MIPISSIPIEQYFEVEIDDIDESSFYVGKAIKDSLTSSSVWQIRKIVEDGDVVTELYADDSTRYNKVWDDRLSYAY